MAGVCKGWLTIVAAALLVPSAASAQSLRKLGLWSNLTSSPEWSQNCSHLDRLSN